MSVAISVVRSVVNGCRSIVECARVGRETDMGSHSQLAWPASHMRHVLQAAAFYPKTQWETSHLVERLATLTLGLLLFRSFAAQRRKMLHRQFAELVASRAFSWRLEKLDATFHHHPSRGLALAVAWTQENGVGWRTFFQKEQALTQRHFEYQSWVS